MFSTSVNSWLRSGESASKIVLWSKVESIWMLCFDVQKGREFRFTYVLGKRSNFLRASFPTFGKYQTPSAKYVLSTMGVSKESISKFLAGNRFHVKLRILNPENCKQSL